MAHNQQPNWQEVNLSFTDLLSKEAVVTELLAIREDFITLLESTPENHPVLLKEEIADQYINSVQSISMTLVQMSLILFYQQENFEPAPSNAQFSAFVHIFSTPLTNLILQLGLLTIQDIKTGTGPLDRINRIVSIIDYLLETPLLNPSFNFSGITFQEVFSSLLTAEDILLTFETKDFPFEHIVPIPQVLYFAIHGILSNARKAASPERPLSVSVDLNVTNTQLQLIFIDTGTGLMETQGYFDATAPTSGYGLQIIKNLGFDVHVENNTSGIGAVAILSIPLHLPSVDPPAEA